MATLYLTASAKADGRGYTQIFVRLSGGKGVTPRAKSGIFAPAHLWSDKKQRLTIPRFAGEEQREALTIQHRLDDLTAHIHEAFANLDDRTAATSSWLASVVDAFHHPDRATKHNSGELEEAFERFMAEKRYSRYRAFSFRRVMRSLHRYGAIRDREVTFETLNERMLADFERFLADEHRYATDPAFAALYANSKDATAERATNTTNEMLTQLRTFIRWSVAQGLTANNPFARFKVKESIYGTPYYLTIEERRRLYECRMPDHLARVRDIFIFQCCVGCRVGDLVKLTPDNVIDGALEYVPRKTKEGNPVTVRVVLNATASEIVERYREEEGGRLLPFVAEAYYNRALKECFTLAGITRKVTTLDPKSREEVKRPLNEVASSHLARRTFVGNLYQQLKDPNIIASMSGHKEGSRAFARYRAIDDRIKAEAVALLD